MASDGPSAWHPARMPNFHAVDPVVPTVDPVETQQQPAETQQPPTPTQTDDASHNTRPIDTSEDASSGVDGWFPDYEAGSPWQPDPQTQLLLSQEESEPIGAAQDVAPEELVSQPEPQQDEPAANALEPGPAPEPAAQHEEPIVRQPESLDATTSSVPFSFDAEPPPPPPSTSKHVSNDSFARTISQQPNWMDDDEPTWSPPPAGPDPFKFMPLNERTNSFPVVPPLQDQPEQQAEPLPANQAEDLMSQIDHDSDPFYADQAAAPQEPSALQQDNFWGNDDVDADFAAQVGGDLQGPDGDASDARYAEGVPLINHDHEDDKRDEDPEVSHDPFAHDDLADGDDFFAQIEKSTDPQNQPDQSPGPLERKSTVQVMNGLGASETWGTSGMVDDVVQEEDEFWSEKTKEEPEAAVATTETAAPADIPATEPTENKGEDIAAKWSEAFAGDDDDEFLLDDEPDAEPEQGKALDPSAFFVDDDEGFLDDVDESTQPTQAPAAPQQPTLPQSAGSSNRYLPAEAAKPSLVTQPSNPYFAGVSPMIPQAQTPLATVSPVVPNPYAAHTQPQSLSTPYGAPPPRPAANKAQSFADRSKGGYSSPYDLPMEIVKPRKRNTQPQQQPYRASAIAPLGPPAPPRTSSTYSQNSPAVPGPPAQAPVPQLPGQGQQSVPGVSPPASNHSGQSPALARPPHSLQSKPAFFEDLPMSNKTRPASRTSSKNQISPSQAGFHRPPPPQGIQPPPSSVGQTAPADLPRLVPQAPVNPYATLPAAANSTPNLAPPGASRYSPATSQGPALNGAVPLPSRYSPAPPAQRPPTLGAGPSATPPSVAPHLPRTSSPLAQFEARPAGGTHGEPGLQQTRSSSSLYEPRLNRMSSLPPTREAEEDEATVQPTSGVLSPPTSSLPPRAGPNQMSSLESHRTGTLSPPKRKISYGPVPTMTDIVPPPRSQTGSPGAMYGLRSPIKPSEIAPRPSSAHGAPTPPVANAVAPTAAVPVASARPRGMSQKLNLIPPTDGRELDPLQRWKGGPLVSWGVGGTLVTSFPVDVPRYGMNQPGPMIVRSPGEIKVKTIKEVQPLEERLAKFPGPLRGKSKKKEATAWLTAGIEELEKSLPNPAFQSSLSHEDKRTAERVLLWKVLRVMIEHDGVLDGNPAVEKAVRDILSLAPAAQEGLTSPIYASGNAVGGFAGESSATQMRADSVDSGTVQQLKKSLLAGDREKAVWDAADKRLWGHALLIANTVSPELYHKVSQEFIKKEVNFPGHNNESLAALYAVLSGNHEESVDELVPMHARAGLQMVATSTGPVSSGGLDGLEQWRETLTLVLSNRSTGDVQALKSLGSLLAGYGRAEAAHICFLFARSVAIFGGLDDPSAQFVLVGADHRTQSQQFFKETEALLLSEVYEYGLSLSGVPSLANGVPHLAVYKLQHAMTLAEHGYRDKALQYCDIILKDMGSQTRRSPYYHPVLESAIEDLRQRIIQAPNMEASNSWISKPSMNKVSDTVWNRFNKFVVGGDTDAAGPGSPKFREESGPFANYAGGTPTISRPASASGFTGMEMFGTPNGYAGGAPPMAPTATTASPGITRAASRYAPAVAQSSAAASSPYEPNSTYSPKGRSSMERTSGEYSRSPYEPRRPSDVLSPSSGGYMPGAPGQGYSEPALGIMSQAAPPPPRPSTTTAQPAPDPNAAGPRTPSFPTQIPFSQQSSPYAPVASAVDDKGDVPNATGLGLQPPSYGYAPPSSSPAVEQPAQTTEVASNTGYGGYEPPSYGYEPPSYQPDFGTTGDNEDAEEESKPKKNSFMDDDDDDFPRMSSTSAQEKSKAEKDRENQELFRKAAEEDGEFVTGHMMDILDANDCLAKRAEEEKAAKAKKGWGFGSWFGGAKKESLDSSAPNKPVRAKLGEKSSFVYDPDQKRWVNKAAGAEDSAPRTATPPPPRATPRPPSGPGPSASAPPLRTGSAPPVPSQGGASPLIPGPASSVPSPMLRSGSTASSIGGGGAGGGPPTAPPSRPATSMSNASSIDDLLGAAVPRKGAAARGKKKGGRYVDVMAK